MCGPAGVARQLGLVPKQKPAFCPAVVMAVAETAEDIFGDEDDDDDDDDDDASVVDDEVDSNLDSTFGIALRICSTFAKSLLTTSFFFAMVRWCLT
jgi:hypothetical protein